MPWCTAKGMAVSAVVSCPPFCVPVPKKKATGFPTSAPLAQSPPIYSVLIYIYTDGVNLE